MKYIFLVGLLFLNSVAFAGEVPKDRYYYNPAYASAEFKASEQASAFQSLPKIDGEKAQELASKDPAVQAMLKQDTNYFLMSGAESYTDDMGKSWTDWEVNVARPVMNSTLRTDAIFSVNPMTGKVTKLNRPIIHQPFYPDKVK